MSVFTTLSKWLRGVVIYHTKLHPRDGWFDPRWRLKIKNQFANSKYGCAIFLLNPNFSKPIKNYLNYKIVLNIFLIARETFFNFFEFYSIQICKTSFAACKSFKERIKKFWNKGPFNIFHFQKFWIVTGKYFVSNQF